MRVKYEKIFINKIRNLLTLLSSCNNNIKEVSLEYNEVKNNLAPIGGVISFFGGYLDESIDGFITNNKNINQLTSYLFSYNYHLQEEGDNYDPFSSSIYLSFHSKEEENKDYTLYDFFIYEDDKAYFTIMINNDVKEYYLDNDNSFSFSETKEYIITLFD